MKMRDLVAILIFMIGLTTGLQAVTYQRQVVKLMTWGSGNYQLGRGYDPATLRENYGPNDDHIPEDIAVTMNLGPGSFIVGPHGDYYLLDRMNSRLLWFDASFTFRGKVNVEMYEGAILAQDNNEYIYVPYFINKVKVFSPDLKYYGKFNFDFSGVGGLNHMTYIPETKFMHFERPRDQYVVDTSAVAEMAKGIRPWGLVETQHVNAPFVKWLGMKGTLSTVKVSLPGFISDRRLIFDIGIHYSMGLDKFVGKDKFGNLFVSYNASLQKGGQGQCLIYVVDTSGSEQTVLLEADDLLFDGQEFLVATDADGNIYHLLQKTSGPVMVKWSR
jgi:hypothetical protein